MNWKIKRQVVHTLPDFAESRIQELLKEEQGWEPMSVQNVGQVGSNITNSMRCYEIWLKKSDS